MTKKILSLLLIGIMLVESKFSVNAANISNDNNYIPYESVCEIISEQTGIELNDGDKIVFDNYTIEVEKQIIYENSNSKSTTTTWSSISSYGVYNNVDSDEWYRITQVTNYTYDGTSVHINTENCKLNVTTYKSNCDYTININTVNNSSTTAPTYTIGLSLYLPLGWLTFVDVATVYTDGTTNLSHTES